MKPRARTQPCESCPYRKDVPSGVWAPSEYRKLLDYDRPTGEQPLEPFACHTSPDWFCTGWLVCHGAKPKRGYELLSIRFVESFKGVRVRIPRPEAVVPLFASGEEAALHGMKGIARPPRAARDMIAKLITTRVKRQQNRKKRKEP